MRSLRLLILPSLLGLWFSGQAGAETGAMGEVRFSSAPAPPTELQVRLARERPAALFGVHALGLPLQIARPRLEPGERLGAEVRPDILGDVDGLGGRDAHSLVAAVRAVLLAVEPGHLTRGPARLVGRVTAWAPRQPSGISHYGRGGGKGHAHPRCPKARPEITRAGGIS